MALAPAERRRAGLLRTGKCVSHANRDAVPGRTTCRECLSHHKEYSKRWRRRYPDRVRKNGALWRKKHHKRVNELARQWAQKHRKQCVQMAMRYYWQHRKQIIKRRRPYYKRWYKKNRKRVIEQNLRYQARHPEKVIGKRRRFYLRHRKAILRQNRRWRKRHPEARAEYWRHRHTAQLGNVGHYTLTEAKALKRKYGFRCLCCGKTERQLKRLGRILVLDHVVALQDPSDKLKGRRDLITNMQPLCHARRKGTSGGCNQRKHIHHIDYRPAFKIEARHRSSLCPQV
jgi:hypothetical protein